MRVAELDEALRVIKAVWTQQRATVAGTHHRVEGAWCAPKPDPVPPLMVGAFKPQMLRVAARHADWWNVSSTGIADYRTYVRDFERACAAVGRDPAAVRRTWCGGCACAPTAGEAVALAGPRLQPGEDFIGTPGNALSRWGRSSSWAWITSCSTAAASPG